MWICRSFTSGEAHACTLFTATLAFQKISELFGLFGAFKGADIAALWPT